MKLRTFYLQLAFGVALGVVACSGRGPFSLGSDLLTTPPPPSGGAGASGGTPPVVAGMGGMSGGSDTGGSAGAVTPPMGGMGAVDAGTDPAPVWIEPAELGEPCGEGVAYCVAGLFCDLPDVVCTGQGGICAAVPTTCPTECVEVCACDGQRYCNACQAQQAGVDSGDAGQCDTEIRCGAWLGVVCPEGYFCDYGPNLTCGGQQRGRCTLHPSTTLCEQNMDDAVCGCNGQLYDNECYANAGGTDRADTCP